MWDVVTGEMVNTLIHHCEAVLHLRFSNGMMVTCSKVRSKSPQVINRVSGQIQLGLTSKKDLNAICNTPNLLSGHSTIDLYFLAKHNKPVRFWLSSAKSADKSQNELTVAHCATIYTTISAIRYNVT